MSVSGAFRQSVSLGEIRPRSRRPAPFSLRLSAAERERLTREAAGVPLGTYIKAKLLDGAPLRLRRSGRAVADHAALGRVLAMLGASRLANNLNQLAYAANIGALPVTPETEAALQAALADVRTMRALLLCALGMRGEEAAPSPHAKASGGI